jgi:hypothetical protein
LGTGKLLSRRFSGWIELNLAIFIKEIRGKFSPFMCSFGVGLQPGEFLWSDLGGMEMIAGGFPTRKGIMTFKNVTEAAPERAPEAATTLTGGILIWSRVLHLRRICVA